MAARRRRRPAEHGDLSICDGRELVGRVVFCGEEWRAELADGRSLGLFETRGEARDAIADARRATR